MQTLTTINKTELLNPEIEFEYFLDFAKNFVSKIEAGEILTKKKVRFSKDTIRQYNVSIGHFESFQDKLSSKIQIHEINKRLLEAFEKHLYNSGLLFNSVYLYISKIKALGNILFDEEQTNRPVKFSTPKKTTTQVYLSENELKQMRDCKELTESEKLILDIFLIQCTCGLRYSTLKEFLEQPTVFIKQHGDNYYIDIISKKTEEQSVIPLSRTIFDILNKYSFKFQSFSEEYFNRVLKNIGKKAGIDNPIAVQITKNSIIETIVQPKYKLLRSHCGRRTFLTIAKNYINDNNALMSMSGHTTERQMANYIRSEKIDRIANVFENDFFKIKI